MWLATIKITRLYWLTVRFISSEPTFISLSWDFTAIGKWKHLPYSYKDRWKRRSCNPVLHRSNRDGADFLWIISENGRRRFRARQELQLVGKKKFYIQVWHMGHRGETWVVRCSNVYWRITSLDDKSKRRQMGMWWLPWPATLSVASSPDSRRFLEDFYSLNTNNA